jgi:hypothetical protein
MIITHEALQRSSRGDVINPLEEFWKIIKAGDHIQALQYLRRMRDDIDSPTGRILVGCSLGFDLFDTTRYLETPSSYEEFVELVREACLQSEGTARVLVELLESHFSSKAE